MAALNLTLAKLAGEQHILLFGDFAREYLKQKMANPTLREATKRSFEHQVLHHLIPTFGRLPLDKVTNAEFLYWVIERRKCAETQKAGHGRITRFFNARKYLIEVLLAAKNDGHIERLPKFDNPDEPKNVGRALSDREVLAILRRTPIKLFRFFFYVLWKTGCRPREILRWEWNMFLWSEPGKTWIDIPARISKTDRTRKIPLNPNVSRRLYAEFRRGNRSHFVFPNPRDPRRPQLSYSQQWNSACKRAKIKAMPYDLRRTFITRCAAAGMPLLYVAKALDTSTKMIESVYAKSQAEVMEGIVK